jgi:hypothetical protein
MDITKLGRGKTLAARDRNYDDERNLSASRCRSRYTRKSGERVGPTEYCLSQRWWLRYTRVPSPDLSLAHDGSQHELRDSDRFARRNTGWTEALGNTLFFYWPSDVTGQHRTPHQGAHMPDLCKLYAGRRLAGQMIGERHNFCAMCKCAMCMHPCLRDVCHVCPINAWRELQCAFVHFTRRSARPPSSPSRHLQTHISPSDLDLARLTTSSDIAQLESICLLIQQYLEL